MFAIYHEDSLYVSEDARELRNGRIQHNIALLTDKDQVRALVCYETSRDSAQGIVKQDIANYPFYDAIVDMRENGNTIFNWSRSEDIFKNHRPIFFQELYFDEHGCFVLRTQTTVDGTFYCTLEDVTSQKFHVVARVHDAESESQDDLQDIRSAMHSLLFSGVDIEQAARFCRPLLGVTHKILKFTPEFFRRQV